MYWALLYFTIAVAGAVVGWGGLAVDETGAAAAQILFFVFLFFSAACVFINRVTKE